MVRHVVMFKFEGDDRERLEVALRFKEALEALPSQIEVLESIEVGLNMNPAEAWDLVLTATVATFPDVATYSAHPAHVEACKIIAGHKKDRACVDYSVD